MKLKKILSLVLAFAMLFSIVGAVQPHAHAIDLHEHSDDDCGCPVEETDAVEEVEEPEESETAEEEAPEITYGPAVYDEEGNLLYYEYYMIPYTPIIDYSEYQLTGEQLALPTEELLELVLNSQLLDFSFSLASTPEMESVSYQTAYANFNGLRELESRPDAVDALLAKLAYYAENLRLSDTIHSSWRVLCRLLEQNVYLEKMSSEQQNSVFEAEVAVYGYSENSTTELQSGGFDNSDQVMTDAIVSTASYEDAPATQEVNNFTYDKKAKAKTTAGYVVPLYSARTDYSASEQVNRAKQMASSAGVTFRGNATSSYNCHSYVWYKTSTSNPCCVFDISEYLNDPHCFVPVRDSTHPLVAGDIIVYWRQETINGKQYVVPVHSALVSSVSGGNITCISKWGAEGLFEHALNRVPVEYTYDDSSIKYTVYTYLTYHPCDVTNINASTHTRVCQRCSFTSTEAHTADALTGKCTVCKYKVTDNPVLPTRKKKLGVVVALADVRTLAPKRPVLSC